MTLDEIYLEKTFEMNPVQAPGKVANYLVKIKSDCSGASFDIQGYCLFE